MPDYHETTLRVRYAETDQMGVVYHSNFIIWFEVGRVEMLRSLGFSYKEMEEQDDTHIVVVSVKCDYKKPARYDDQIRIRTRLTDARSRILRFAYEIFNDTTGELLATGETGHVTCDSQGRPKSLPEKYRAHFAAAAAAPGTEQPATA
jgi:acyl-CoA thioester hydrolase